MLQVSNFANAFNDGDCTNPTQESRSVPGAYHEVHSSVHWTRPATDRFGTGLYPDGSASQGRFYHARPVSAFVISTSPSHLTHCRITIGADPSKVPYSEFQGGPAAAELDRWSDFQEYALGEKFISIEMTCTDGLYTST